MKCPRGMLRREKLQNTSMEMVALNIPSPPIQLEVHGSEGCECGGPWLALGGSQGTARRFPKSPAQEGTQIPVL